MDILDKIPEARTMLAWKLARLLKEKEPVVVPDKPTNKPVNPPMFFNPLI